jgi:FMN phosphatase YigB (HAD superfamily)
MANIQNIIFDLGGVIINLDNQLTENSFTALGVKNFRELFGHGHAASFFREYEIGKISDRQFLDNLKKLAQIEVPDQAVIDSFNIMLLDFPPERIALIRELRKRYRIFLFSNTNAMHLAALQKIYDKTFPGETLEDLFEKTYYSNLLGMRKPDKESYDYIVAENHLDAGRTLFVDDALINVEGANAAGLKGFFLKPGTSLVDVEWDF